MILETIDTHPFMWYGCVIKPEGADKPVLFSLNRMGYLMDGAEISDDDGVYEDFSPSDIGIVKCLFIKDGNAISPEQASEDHRYQDLSFEVKCEDVIQEPVSIQHGKIHDLFELLNESPNDFKGLLEDIINGYLEEELDGTPYRAALITAHDKEGNKAPYMMFVDRLGRITEPLKCAFSKEESHPIFDIDKIRDDEAIAVHILFQDGTKPISMNEARSLIEEGEMGGVFMQSTHIGSLMLSKDSGFDTWEEALNNDNKDMTEILKFGLFSLAENSEFEKAQEEEGQSRVSFEMDSDEEE